MQIPNSLVRMKGWTLMRSSHKSSVKYFSLGLAAIVSGSLMLGAGPASARGTMQNVRPTPEVSRAVINGEEYSVCRMVVHASPDTIWSIIADYSNLHRVFKQMKKATVLENKGKVKLVKHTVAPSGPVGTYSYVVRVKESAPHKMEWKRVSGAFKDVKGFWKLEPLDGGRTTRVTYASHVDGGFLIPKALVKRQCRIDMPIVVSNLRSKAESQIRIAGKPAGTM